MIKKIVHCADIHIRTFRMHSEYKEIFTDFISEVKQLCTGLEYDEIRIVVVGDLVHQKITISNEQLILSCWLLNELSKIGKVVVIAGNHDLLENNKDRIDSITPMIQLLDNPNIAYYKESKCYQDNNIVWCNYSIFEENSRPDIESYISETQPDEGVTFIGLYHAPILGATTDTGYEFQDNATPVSHFEGCDMVLMGDIHKRQVFYYKETPIAYPSSLIQQNFGENVNGHGFLLWDVETKEYTEHDISTRYGFYNFKIKSLDDIDNETEKLVNG